MNTRDDLTERSGEVRGAGALAPSGEDVLCRVLRCRYPVAKSINPRGFDWDTSRLDDVMADLLAPSE